MAGYGAARGFCYDYEVKRCLINKGHIRTERKSFSHDKSRIEYLEDPKIISLNFTEVWDWTAWYFTGKGVCVSVDRGDFPRYKSENFLRLAALFPSRVTEFYENLAVGGSCGGMKINESSLRNVHQVPLKWHIIGAPPQKTHWGALTPQFYYSAADSASLECPLQTKILCPIEQLVAPLHKNLSGMIRGTEKIPVRKFYKAKLWLFIQ